MGEGAEQKKKGASGLYLQSIHIGRKQRREIVNGSLMVGIGLAHELHAWSNAQIALASDKCLLKPRIVKVYIRG